MFKALKWIVDRSARRRTNRVPGIHRLKIETLEDRLCPSQYLLVTDYNHHSVVRYDGTDGSYIDTIVPGATSGMTSPDLGVIQSPYTKSFLVGGSGSHNVTRYSLGDGSPQPAPGQTGANFVPPSSGGLVGTEGIAFGPDGNFYVANHISTISGDILKYDGTTGAYLSVFVAVGSGELAAANDLRFGPDGNLYVSNFDSVGKVLRFNGVTGDPMPSAGQTGANFITPLTQYANGFVFGPDNNLYLAVDPNISVGTASSILRFDGSSGAPLPAPGQTGAIFVPPGNTGFIDGIAFDDAGNLYATDADQDVKQFDGTSGALLSTFVTSGSGGLGIPAGLLFYNGPPPGPATSRGSKELAPLVSAPSVDRLEGPALPRASSETGTTTTFAAPQQLAADSTVSLSSSVDAVFAGHARADPGIVPQGILTSSMLDGLTQAL
jgi:sugar lactone lactonase YvrE